MAILNALYNIHYSTFFRPEKFYCQVELGDGIVFKVWEKPGRWMEKEKIENLLADMRHVALAANGSKEIPNYGVMKGDPDDLKNRLITIGYEKKTGKPVGFAAQIFLDVPLGIKIAQVLHLGLVYVVPAFQKKSVVSLLYILPNILLLQKRGFRPLWISSVTQVPSVVGIVADYYHDVYPDPIHNNRQSLMHKSLSDGIIKFHRVAFGTGDDASYDGTQQIIFNSYTGGSDNLKKKFEACPRYRDERVNLFCQENLDYNRGDDFIQIGVLSGRLIHNFFKKRVAGVSNIQWLAYLSVAGIFITLLPILKWLTRKPETHG